MDDYELYEPTFTKTSVVCDFHPFEEWKNATKNNEIENLQKLLHLMADHQYLVTSKSQENFSFSILHNHFPTIIL